MCRIFKEEWVCNLAGKHTSELNIVSPVSLVLPPCPCFRQADHLSNVFASVASCVLNRFICSVALLTAFLNTLFFLKYKTAQGSEWESLFHDITNASQSAFVIVSCFASLQNRISPHPVQGLTPDRDAQCFNAARSVLQISPLLELKKYTPFFTLQAS